MKTRTIFYTVSVLTILAGFILVGTLAYWNFNNYKILEFREGNGTIKQAQIKAGGYLEMRQNSCKFIEMEGRIDRQFIDSVVYQVPTSVNNRPTGCVERTEIIYIPKALSPGIYYISTTITYKVNPIREVVYTVKTNTFEIIK